MIHMFRMTVGELKAAIVDLNDEIILTVTTYAGLDESHEFLNYSQHGIVTTFGSSKTKLTYEEIKKHNDSI